METNLNENLEIVLNHIIKVNEGVCDIDISGQLDSDLLLSIKGGKSFIECMNQNTKKYYELYCEIQKLSDNGKDSETPAEKKDFERDHLNWFNNFLGMDSEKLRSYIEREFLLNGRKAFLVI